jgi:uncharacterized SAM-binding protein YcdF (DUF218 family)
MTVGQRARTWILILILCLALPAVVLLGFITVGALLVYPVSAEKPTTVDLVVVLGGDGGERYVGGRQLVLDGFSRRLLLINAADSVRKDATHGLRGVDIRFDDGPRNTWQEAQAVRAWMQANGWRSAVVVSDPPHMLRVGYAFASNFRGTGLHYSLVASRPPWWSAWQWWVNPVSTSFVISEVVKLGYYLVQYRFGLF